MTPRTIRQSHEAPFFALWRDPALLVRLARPQFLTTARYEPILRRSIGQGQVDLLFESGPALAVLGGVRLDSNKLITRERSPLIWPAAVAAGLPAEQLFALEDAIVPWLRALARGRAMASETIRSFAPSERFERARAAGLLGAAPLARAVVAMAPFIYARRFAAGAHVALDGPDAALGHAVLADVAASFAYSERARTDTFRQEWYGVSAPPVSGGEQRAHLAIGGADGPLEAPVVITTGPEGSGTGAIVEVPSPAGWDVLFTFDVADAPAADRFAVAAIEAPLREPAPLGPAAAIGGSSGVIVLAIGAEAAAMRGCDVDEVRCFGDRLRAEGFTVHVVTATTDPAFADAQLVHIFGAPAEPHTTAFGEFALARGIDVVFDVPPHAPNATPDAEDLYALMHRSALDGAEIDRYLTAFAAGRLELNERAAGTTAAEIVRRTAHFAQLARRAAAVLALEEDVGALCETLAFQRVFARGAFLEPEVAADEIGHLVPSLPFAFAHGPIGSRSHLLPVALAAERHGVPLVIAGPVYDVDYLQTVRAVAPDVIVLADAAPALVSSLYRRAAVYVDAAPRPPTAAGLLRAVACGAFPVIADDSPLGRLTEPTAPRFRSASAADCAAVLGAALRAPDRAARIDDLRRRLMPRCDPAAALRSVVTAYACAATTV